MEKKNAITVVSKQDNGTGAKITDGSRRWVNIYTGFPLYYTAMLWIIASCQTIGREHIYIYLTRNAVEMPVCKRCIFQPRYIEIQRKDQKCTTRDHIQDS